MMIPGAGRLEGDSPVARRVIAYGLVVLVVAPIPLGVLWLLATARPPGYTRAADFTTAEIEEQAALFVPVKSRFANTLLDASGGTPLDVTLTDRMVNAEIRLQPEAAGEKLPDWIWNPQVVFTREAVALMADVRVKGAEMVLSIRLAPEVTGDGRLRLRLAGMRAGRLPLPDAVAAAVADHADRRAGTLERRLRDLEAEATKVEAAGAKAKKETRRRMRYARLELEAARGAADLCRGSQEIVVDMQRFHLALEAIELGDGQVRIVGRRAEKPAEPQ
jgi:hypothetical protein